MSFFLLKNDKLTEIEFDYLKKGGDEVNRLDPTLVPGREQVDRVKKDKTYAIEVMSKPVVTLEHQALVEEALNIFQERGYHHLIISQKDRIKGFVSDRDILSLKEESHKTMISRHMSTLVLTCHEETEIAAIAKVMVREKVSALPVVDDDHKVSGIVTHHDLLRWIYE